MFYMNIGHTEHCDRLGCETEMFSRHVKNEEVVARPPRLTMILENRDSRRETEMFSRHLKNEEVVARPPRLENRDSRVERPLPLSQHLGQPGGRAGNIPNEKTRCSQHRAMKAGAQGSSEKETPLHVNIKKKVVRRLCVSQSTDSTALSVPHCTPNAVDLVAGLCKDTAANNSKRSKYMASGIPVPSTSSMRPIGNAENEKLRRVKKSTVRKTEVRSVDQLPPHLLMVQANPWIVERKEKVKKTHTLVSSSCIYSSPTVKRGPNGKENENSKDAESSVLVSYQKVNERRCTTSLSRAPLLDTDVNKQLDSESKKDCFVNKSAMQFVLKELGSIKTKVTSLENILTKDILGISANTESNQEISNNTESNQGISNNTESNQGISNNTESNQEISNNTESNRGISNNTEPHRGISNNTESHRGISNNTESNQGISNSSNLNLLNIPTAIRGCGPEHCLSNKKRRSKSVHAYNDMRTSYKFLKTPDTAFVRKSLSRGASKSSKITPNTGAKQISLNVCQQLANLYDSE